VWQPVFSLNMMTSLVSQVPALLNLFFHLSGTGFAKHVLLKQSGSLHMFHMVLGKPLPWSFGLQSRCRLCGFLADSSMFWVEFTSTLA
jgi:hypothetical protein